MQRSIERTIIDFKERYDYLSDNDQVDLLYDEVLKEHRLKLYGSMLVLCRLSCSRDEVKAFLPDNEFQFWLVTTTASSDSVILMDNLTDNLRDFLKSPLTREMMDVVDIIPSTKLAEKLSDEAIDIE